MKTNKMEMNGGYDEYYADVESDVYVKMKYRDAYRETAMVKDMLAEYDDEEMEMAA